MRLAQDGKREPDNPVKGEVSVDMQVICYILTSYEQKLHDLLIKSGSELLLESNHLCVHQLLRETTTFQT